MDGLWMVCGWFVALGFPRHPPTAFDQTTAGNCAGVRGY